MMVGLTARFFGLIMSSVREISLAQRARLVQMRRNPLYRMVALVLPLLRRSFEQADEIAMAMEARCYDEKSAAAGRAAVGRAAVGRTYRFKASKQDWILLGVVAAVCIPAVLV
jgi:energy-coupling factor transporter transmembrane protein EcfT